MEDHVTFPLLSGRLPWTVHTGLSAEANAEMLRDFAWDKVEEDQLLTVEDAIAATSELESRMAEKGIV